MWHGHCVHAAALVIVRKRSLGQGNIFTIVCLSTGGCIPACNGAGVYTPLDTDPLGRHSRWTYTPPRQASPWTRIHTSPRETPRDNHWSGQYASYWNAFLFLVCSSLLVEHHQSAAPTQLSQKALWLSTAKVLVNTSFVTGLIIYK